MLIKLLSCLYILFRNDLAEERKPSARESMLNYYPVISPKQEELTKIYPYSASFILMNSYSGSDFHQLSYETLKKLNLVGFVDYEIYQNTIYFKTLEMRQNFYKVGYELADHAKAAIVFSQLDKREMGLLSFTEYNTFYITVKPIIGKEKELLKEVTFFYKNNGYAVDQKYFQDNFCTYKNFSIIFYVADEAMAAELNFYITSKDLGTVI